MNAIGGYFELELRGGNHYHSRALRLNTARNCLEYILRVRQYRKIYIPYYSCEVVLEPLKKCGVKWEFYHVGLNLDPVEYFSLKEDEAFLYTNYFGIKQTTVEKLSEYYGRKLIVDNSQAFFSDPVDGLDSFYSARKFFGVSDGAYLYIDQYLSEDFEIDVSYERAKYLLKRVDCGAEFAYIDFQKSEKGLSNAPIKLMSKLTESVLCSLDYEYVKGKRRSNYCFLDSSLGKINKLKVELDSSSVPMVYPYFSDDKLLRERLIKNKIFVATYWPNVFQWCTRDDWEYALSECVIPFPVDQRYGEDQMITVINAIQDFSNKTNQTPS